MKPKTLTSIDAIAEYCQNLKGEELPRRLFKKFKEVVLNHYDQDGPGSYEDIKSEIYVHDKARFVQDFFEDLNIFLFETDPCDLYVPFQERSLAYQEAYFHTARNNFNWGGLDAICA